MCETPLETREDADDDEGASDVAGGGDYDDADERHQIWPVGPLVVKTVDACVELWIAITLVEEPPVCAPNFSLAQRQRRVLWM